jgi:hypothetical protein
VQDSQPLTDRPRSIGDAASCIDHGLPSLTDKPCSVGDGATYIAQGDLE